MCGIAGIVEPRDRDRAPALDQAVKRMVECLEHRGPDGTGWFNEDGVALGHARLSILDIEHGDQPMFDESGSRVLVYNGEVYNFNGLRETLTHHRFESTGDTEVLVHLFEELGAPFARLLDGMFAYAIWSRDEESLYCGVDPFGIKPLYYSVNGQTLLFSSELGSILEGMRSLGLAIRLDERSCRRFLETGWFAAPSTPVVGVRKLAPGMQIKFKPARGGVEVLEAESEVGSDFARFSDDPVSQLGELVQRSVREQLVSDVPVGVLLSGGIDSSLVSTYASRESPHISTFTVAFEGTGRETREVDEARFAARVAEHLGTDHHEISVKEEALRDDLDEALSAMDEPIADPATLPLLAVSRFARQSVKVCLCGDGGDELFGGYQRHLIAPYKQIWHSLPSAAREVLGFVPRRVLDSGFVQSSRAGRRFRAGWELLDTPEYIRGPFGGDEGRWLAGGKDPASRPAAFPMKEETLYREDMAGQLAGQLLPKTDRIGMAASLEIRVPFLSKEVAGFARSLPRRYRVRGRQTKYILRALARRSLPPEITERRKQGFRVPIGEWFREGLSGELHRRLIEEKNIPDTIIPGHGVQKLISEHSDGTADHSLRLWCLLALHKWIGSHITCSDSGAVDVEASVLQG